VISGAKTLEANYLSPVSYEVEPPGIKLVDPAHFKYASPFSSQGIIYNFQRTWHPLASNETHINGTEGAS